MYNPPHFKVEDIAKLKAFLLANSFATLVSTVDGAPFASHLPLHLVEADGTLRLAGHFAKANPHWKQLDGQKALAIFHGPHAYVSPTQYEHNTGIPTWNYVAVHAAGIARITHDREEKLAVLRRMFAKYESQVQHDFEAQSGKFQEGQLSAIVAVEIELDSFEGKFKLSQNRSDADQHVVAGWLAESPHTSVRATGELMQQNLQEKNGNEKQNHG